jgi:hypothetical protein
VGIFTDSDRTPVVVESCLSVTRMLLGCMKDPRADKAMRLRHGGVRVFAMQRTADRVYNVFTEYGGAATGGSHKTC